MDVIFFVFGVLLMALFWIMLHDSTHFEKTEYVVADPRIQKDIRAVVLADLHNQRFGRDNELLLNAIREGRPDVVLIAGDLMTAKPGKEFTPALELLRELAKDYPVCYGVGNHEHRIRLYRKIYGDMGSRYREALSEINVKLMSNERRVFAEYGIEVIGSQIHHRYYRRKKKTPMRDTYLPGILGAPDKSAFTILLAHNPDYFPEYAAWGADLVLSGHVHGGVARIPFWNKGVVSPAMKLFPKYDGGLFEEGNSRMLLSRGLGCHTIPFRVFNPGDLIFLQFKKSDRQGIEKLSRKLPKNKKAL